MWFTFSGPVLDSISPGQFTAWWLPAALNTCWLSGRWHHQALWQLGHVKEAGAHLRPAWGACLNAILTCCCCSVTRSCPTLCHPVDCSTPAFPVHHSLLEFAQIRIYRVGNAIPLSYPLLSPSPLAQSFPASGFFFSPRLMWGVVR